jgi:hypothetical protein
VSNRSYLYSVDIHPDKDPDFTRSLKGIAEFAYDIPLAFKILVSHNTRLCTSSIWDDDEENEYESYALIGDYQEGVARLNNFIARIDHPEALSLRDRAMEFLQDAKNQQDFFVLEILEIYELDAKETLKKYAESLRAEISNIDVLIQQAYREISPLDELEKLCDLGIDYWSPYLYYDFSGDEPSGQSTPFANPEPMQSIYLENIERRRQELIIFQALSSHDSESYSTKAEFSEALVEWLNKTLGNATTDEVAAFVFSLAEIAGDYVIELVGTRDFSFDHTNWLADDIWEPSPRVLFFSKEIYNSDNELCLNEVRRILFEYILHGSAGAQSLLNSQGVVLGFVDDSIVLLWGPNDIEVLLKKVASQPEYRPFLLKSLLDSELLTIGVINDDATSDEMQQESALLLEWQFPQQEKIIPVFTSVEFATHLVKPGQSIINFIGESLFQSINDRAICLNPNTPYEVRISSSEIEMLTRDHSSKDRTVH